MNTGENFRRLSRLFRLRGLGFDWPFRLRTAKEVSSAVLFLHKARPCPIIHRDIKPANILLGHDLSAKIGDVGLARMAPELSEKSALR